jgi:hypothetical protein
VKAATFLIIAFAIAIIAVGPGREGGHVTGLVIAGLIIAAFVAHVLWRRRV